MTWSVTRTQTGILIQTMKLTSKVILTQIGILIQKAILTRGGN